MGNEPRFFQVGPVPMIGNPGTGHLIGLSADEVTAARSFAEGQMSLGEVARVSSDLADQLRLGSYGAPPQTVVRSAYLHVTHRCNLSCEGCYSWEGQRNQRRDPTFGELDRALRFLERQGVEELNVSGGEPFLRADLPDILARAAGRYGMAAVNVLTNGTVLDRAVLKACAPFASMVSVSFDGASAADPAFVRGRQRFDDLVAFVRAAQGAGLAVCITPTLHRCNIEDIPRYRALADSLGAELGFSVLSANSHGGVRASLLPGDRELRRLAELMLDCAEACEAVPVESLACGLSCRENCGAGITTLSVAADGAVYPCHMMHDDRFCLGNAFSGEEPSRDARGAMADMVHAWDEDSACFSCEYRWLCGGGCRARAIGSQTREDPYCETHKVFYRGVIDHIEQHLAKEEDHAVSQ